jgi:hypothetical protein
LILYISLPCNDYSSFSSSLVPVISRAARDLTVSDAEPQQFHFFFVPPKADG